jgi:beta-lactamase regulating signal transducer with metallopeptidase domain
LAWLALAATALGVLRFAISAGALSRRLHHRTVVTEPRLVQRLEELRARTHLARVRLTESALLSSPLVIGRSEICLPHGLATMLTDEGLDAVLAHELAHLERRDGLGFPLVGALQCTLWFQPLNHVVASRFRSSAELSCDDRAVELTKNPHALGCALVRLAEVASALSGSALAPAIVRRRSGLHERVERLAALSAHDRGAARGRWRAFMSVTVIGVTLVTMSVRVVHAQLPLASDAALDPTLATASGDAVSSLHASEQSAKIAELAARDRELTAALARLSTSPQAAHEGAPEHTHTLELEQELRHLRAMQTWLEQRFIATQQSETQH